MFKKVENQQIIEEKLSDGAMKRYVRGRLLGKGGFAKCYEVISLQTQKKYAAKIIEKAGLEKSKAKQKLTSEIKIHKSLTHPYIVHFEHYFEDAQYVYILLQKCSNQTLNELLKRRKRLTDIETKYYIRQIALALKYIHDQKIIHRDLKLGNLFLSEKLQIKIGDFGLATRLSYQGQRRKTQCGTPNYIAPQILDSTKTHSYEVDIWSMGVIAYTLLVGRPPFESNDIKETYARIKECSYDYKGLANVISDEAKFFVSRMLQLDPSKRASIDEILQDPFLLESTIPPLLPISSLACPPSFDFLKKYRDIQPQDIFKTNQTVDKGRQQAAKIVVSLQKNENIKISKIEGNSIQKSLKRPKVSSAANLLLGSQKLQAQNTKFKSRKVKGELQLEKKAVKIWVTYFEENPKFGLGYLLNSGSTGFKFNDSTAMISNNKISSVKYIDFDQKLKKLREKEAVIYTKVEAEEHETKKFKILQHFYRQLTNEKRERQKKIGIEEKMKVESSKSRETAQNIYSCYVIRYHRSSKSTIFWLSIGAIQVVFQDSSQILVNSNGIVTYVNKFLQFTYFEEKNKQSQSQEIKKRLLHFYSIVKTTLLRKDGKVGENRENENHGLNRRKSKQSNTSSGKVLKLNSSNLNKLNCSNREKHLRPSSSNTNLIQRSFK